MHSELNRLFVEQFESQFGGDSERLLAALDGEPSVSVRYNPFKCQRPVEGNEVEWNRYGRFLSERSQFTLDPLLHAGLYYVQESSSMFVEHLLRSAFDSTEGLRVLDMCAAPGGKTTLYSTVVGLEGLVVANEPVRDRVAALKENVDRWGLANTVVTCNAPDHFAALEGWFDVVAVDAPCSGEGMFRKSNEAREQWSEQNVRLCVERQRDILEKAWVALREGGVLIYSTCTFNRHEDEENVEWLSQMFDVEAVDADVPERWGIRKSMAGDVACWRFMPGEVRGEGFFAVALRKGGYGSRGRLAKAQRQPFAPVNRALSGELARWVNQPEAMSFWQVAGRCHGYYRGSWDDVKTVSERMNVVGSGVCMGELFGGRLRPDHRLATFHDVNRGVVSTIDVDLQTALALLRLESVVPDNFAEGINLVSFEGLPFAWVKRVGGRVNNMIPKQLRVRI